MPSLHYAFSTLCLGAAIWLLCTRHLLYAALLLLFCLLGVAALYAMLGADFLAISQLIIYIGGVLVLLMFGIMLTHHPASTVRYPDIAHKNIVQSSVLGVLLFVFLGYYITQTKWETMPWLARSRSSQLISDTTLPSLGVGLMTDYLLGFEIAGVLLLIALIGATAIASQSSSPPTQD